MDIRKLEFSEHSLVPNLYERTYNRPRSQAHQNWLEKNPMGRPVYYGAFEDKKLFGLTGLLPWALDAQQKAWQIGEVLVDQVKRKQGIFSKILTLVFGDIKQGQFDAPVFTLPNPSSEPGFHKYSDFDHSYVPRWCLWLQATSSPLSRFHNLAPYLNFLLPKSPQLSTADWQKIEEFTGNFSNFLNWRFGLKNPKPWEIISLKSEQCCYQITNEVLQIGRLPQNQNNIESFISHLKSIASQKSIGRLEWAGQATNEQKEILHYCGFRTSLLNKNTWRNALFTDNSTWPLLNRIHFDT